MTITIIIIIIAYVQCDYLQLHDTDGEISRGGRIVRRIGRRIVQHKIIFAVVVLVILVIIGLMIFGIVMINKSQNKWSLRFMIAVYVYNETEVLNNVNFYCLVFVKIITFQIKNVVLKKDYVRCLQ